MLYVEFFYLFIDVIIDIVFGDRVILFWGFIFVIVRVVIVNFIIFSRICY